MKEPTGDPPWGDRDSILSKHDKAEVGPSMRVVDKHDLNRTIEAFRRRYLDGSEDSEWEWFKQTGDRYIEDEAAVRRYLIERGLEGWEPTLRLYAFTMADFKMRYGSRDDWR